MRNLFLQHATHIESCGSIRRVKTNMSEEGRETEREGNFEANVVDISRKRGEKAHV